MKSILLSILFLLAATLANATVRIADNNANRPTAGTGVFIYAGLQAAITASTSGDTILVIPSTSTYGTVNTFGKSDLTIIGAGFNPGSNLGLTSQITTLQVYDNASNFKFIGLEISTIQFINNTNQSLSNVIIENCAIRGITNSIISLANVFIRQNVFTTTTVEAISMSAATQTNIQITNNIFSGADDTNDGLINITTGGATIDHNLFIGTGTGNSRSFESVSNCLVSNNIFYGRTPSARSSMTDITFQNNLIYQVSPAISDDAGLIALGTGNAATANVFADPQFEDVPGVSASLTSWDFNYDASLKAGSSALGAGNDVIVAQRDLGIYGGSSPFKNSGSVVPVVKSLLMPSTIQQGTNTTADIEVTGN